jgi:hypothetical protein
LCLIFLLLSCFSTHKSTDFIFPWKRPQLPARGFLMRRGFSAWDITVNNYPNVPFRSEQLLFVHIYFCDGYHSYFPNYQAWLSGYFVFCMYTFAMVIILIFRITERGWMVIVYFVYVFLRWISCLFSELPSGAEWLVHILYTCVCVCVCVCISVCVCVCVDMT